MWPVGRASIEVFISLFPELLLAHMESVWIRKKKCLLPGLQPHAPGMRLDERRVWVSICSLAQVLLHSGQSAWPYPAPWVCHSKFLYRTPDFLKTKKKQEEFCHFLFLWPKYLAQWLQIWGWPHRFWLSFLWFGKKPWATVGWTLVRTWGLEGISCHGSW